MAKYKVGDKVRIVNRRTILMDHHGEMDKWIGKTMTIRMVVSDDVYFMEEDKNEHGGYGWAWHDSMFSGLAEPKKPEFSISIRFHGRLTVAELIKDGKVVKVENARCNLSDKYNMAEGARIAVERLFKKTADKPEEVIKPKIGDKFVIMSNKSPNCRHHFRIGSVVTTLEHIRTGENLYIADDGLVQIVQDCDVAPYREKAK